MVMLNFYSNYIVNFEEVFVLSSSVFFHYDSNQINKASETGQTIIQIKVLFFKSNHCFTLI